METTPTCPVCGKPLKTGAPHGLCPACLLESGFETRSGKPGGGQSSFVPPPVEEVAKFFPQLEIIGLLGRGGMGSVYKARQLRLNRLVAVKILSPERQNVPEFAERFEREARALASLTHPNIVTVYDFGEVQGNFYLLMEFVDGLSLRDVLRAGKLSPAGALDVVPKVCAALQYAHEKGIVHRDIKPENILIDQKGNVKIADFGIAKIIDLAAKEALTGAMDVIGTPHYMAPEQISQPNSVDARADIYSLGVVFYEMLTGELPLGRFPPPSQKVQIDVRVDEVVLHSLEKEPERRYQHVSEVKTAVETIASNPIPSKISKPDAPQDLAPSKRSSSGWKIAAAIAGFAMLFLVAGVVAILFLALRKHSAPQLPRDGLVALWRGEGDSKDSVGKHNAIFQNVSYTEGKVGMAFALNGTNCSAKVPASPALDMEHTPGLTVCAWIKPNDVDGFHPIIQWDCPEMTPHSIGVHMRLGRHPDAKGQLTGIVVDIDGHYHTLNSPQGAIVDGRFQHVALTYDQKTGVGALYIDGSVVAQVSWKSFTPKTKGDIWISYRPSANYNSFTYNTYLSGVMDELAIYNRALTPSEIQTYYYQVTGGKRYVSVPIEQLRQFPNETNWIAK